MRNKGVFSLTGSSFTYVFIQQLLLFAILIGAVFAAAIIMFPDMSAGLAAAFGGSASVPIYLIIEMVMSMPDQFMMMFLIMLAAAVFVSPVAGGAAAYLNDHAFKDKECTLKNSMIFMGRNYGRLLGAYALQIIITVALSFGFIIFVYYILHNWQDMSLFHPLMVGVIAGILLVMGAIQFTPYCCVYGKKGGGAAIVDSFRTFFKGGFGFNILFMIIGALIWLAIATLPTYIVLASLCPEGESVSSLLYMIDIPGQDPLLWIVLMLSFIVATLFMFDYCQALFFSAKRRTTLKYR